MSSHFEDATHVATSPRVTFVFIRHGEAHESRCDHDNKLLRQAHDEETQEMLAKARANPCLTERGVKQARETEKHLRAAMLAAKENGDDLKIFCSPMNRAKDTLYQFLRHSDQPFRRVPIYYQRTMLEYQPEIHETAEKFVDQMLSLFSRLEAEAKNAELRTTIFLFGHSVMISTILLILATHNHKKTHREHRRCVLERMLVPQSRELVDDPFELANCSISVAHAWRGVIDEAVDFVEWKILAAGKSDHLRAAGLLTGYQSDF